MAFSSNMNYMPCYLMYNQDEPNNLPTTKLVKKAHGWAIVAGFLYASSGSRRFFKEVDGGVNLRTRSSVSSITLHRRLVHLHFPHYEVQVVFGNSEIVVFGRITAHKSNKKFKYLRLYTLLFNVQSGSSFDKALQDNNNVIEINCVLTHAQRYADDTALTAVNPDQLQQRTNH